MTQVLGIVWFGRNIESKKKRNKFIIEFFHSYLTLCTVCIVYNVYIYTVRKKVSTNYQLLIVDDTD